MTDFATMLAAATAPPPDPHKHVNYAVGMVLGVDDFTQEFTYLSALNQWLARDLIGYGTVSGLQVSLSGTNPVSPTSTPQINVSAGVAITPQGQIVRITQDQCAKINDWLAQHQSNLNTMFSGTTTGKLTTYVVLCYNNQPTDDVPIPGEPCRDEKDIMRPSRLSDDFGLDLRLINPNVTPPITPPNQRTEEAIRAFVVLLKQVQVVNNAPFLSTVDFETAINTINTSTIPYSFVSPTPIRIPAAQAGNYMSRAFRIWVTQFIQQWRDNVNFGAPPLEACLALAEVDIQVSKDAASGVWSVSSGNTSVTVNIDPHRPYLIPMRLLQEWLLNGLMSANTVPPTPPPPPISIVAAGTFQFPVNATNKQLTGTNLFNSLTQTNPPLTATQLGNNTSLFLLEGGFQQNGKYIVKGTPIANGSVAGAAFIQAQTFEYIPSVASDTNLVVLLAGLTPPRTVASGLVVRVGQAANVVNATTTGFMVEISQIA
jgi:hypothetical protein